MGESSALSIPSNPNKLLAGSFKAHSALSARSAPEMKMLCYDKIESGSECSMTPDYPTVFQTGNSKSVYSGVVKKRPAPRKRPPKSVRMQRPRLLMVRGEDSLEDRREGKQEVSSKKRKCTVEVDEPQTSTKAVDYMPWHFLSLQLEIYHFRSLPDDMEVSHTSPSHLANDFSRWISRTAAGTRGESSKSLFIGWTLYRG
ncbi:hypothetical protein Bca101_068538 [Brassica carinata]